MNQVALYIFYFLIGTTILNFLIAVTARAKTGNKEFNFLILYWVSLFATYGAVATLSRTPDEIAFAYFFQFVPSFLMTKILRDSRKIETNWWAFCGIHLVGSLTSAFLILSTEVSFTVSLMPITITTSLPFLSPIWNVLVSHRKEANWVEKALAILFITGVIHHFNYAFFRLDESAAWWGWSVSIAQYQCLSIFLPLLINLRRERNERSNLELALLRLSGQDVSDSASEISDLYRTLELQILQKEEVSLRLSDTNARLEEERVMNEILIKSISHDLANPLTVVSAYLEMIMSGKISPEDKEKFQDRMRLNLTSAMAMIARIRKAIVTRSEAEVIKVSNVDLKGALKRTEALFHERLMEKNIKFNIRLPERSLEVLADENALVEHVFSNVLSNAIKFSFENSEIDLHIRESGDRIQIEFRDYGVGINPTVMEKPRFHSTPGTRGEEGTGFGLIVMGYFMRKFGADLKIISHTRNAQLGGTSFIITMKNADVQKKHDDLNF